MLQNILKRMSALIIITMLCALTVSLDLFVKWMAILESTKLCACQCSMPRHGDVSGGKHWYELYRKYAIPGIEKNLEFENKTHWWYIELYQMQISMLLLNSIEQDSSLNDKYMRVMELAAGVAKRQIEKHKKHLQIVNVDFSTLPTPWREGEFVIRKNSITMPDRGSLFHGYPYFMPEIDEQFHHILEILRAVGQLGFVVFSIESRQAELEKCKKWFTEIAENLDYDHHATYAPINILHAYWKYIESKETIIENRQKPACCKV